MDFGLIAANTLPLPAKIKKRKIDVIPRMDFELTNLQKQVSKNALSALSKGKDVLIYAAAGAGKTEITYESICAYLRQGKKVCFAISRRQVVLEIAKRLQQVFPDLSVIPVCAGYTSITDADLIVCTTHQLYRYPFAFDLLILDELDAFPYCGNEVLESIAMQSCIGQKMYLSATPDPKSMQQIKEGKIELLTLFSRPHGKPLCVPVLARGSAPVLFIRMLYKARSLVKQNRQVLVYVCRIKDLWWMKLLFSLFVKTDCVHSSSKNRDEILDTFRNRKTDVLLCTTLLERGITIPSVQVLVYRADHRVFTCASLIQIFGRVGRSMKDPEGEGICYITKITPALKECIAQIKEMNRSVTGATRK
jgi:competence protein ComFA